MEMPRDMSMKPCKPVVPIEPGHVDEDALSGCVTKILARLASARRPVLMVGVEVRRFGKEEALATLAGQLDIPVVTSFMGCGLLVESATPPLAPYMGMTDSTEITELVENADTLFLLAVVLSDTNFGVSQRQIDLRHTIQANDGRVTLGFTRSQIFRLRRSLRHCLNAPFHGRTRYKLASRSSRKCRPGLQGSSPMIAPLRRMTSRVRSTIPWPGTDAYRLPSTSAIACSRPWILTTRIV